MAGVIHGPGARGQAGIFGTSLNPVSYYVQNQAANERYRQAQAEEARKRRDSAIDDSLKWDPDKAWEPFTQALVNHVQNNVRRPIQAAYESGVPTNQVKLQAAKLQGDTNGMAAKTVGLKDSFIRAHDLVKQDEYVGDKATAQGRINDWRDEMVKKANAGQWDQINDQGIQNITADPGLWDKQKIFLDHMKALPDLVTKSQRAIADLTKEGYREEDTKTKLGFQKDASGKNYLMDTRTGMPAIHMTDEVYQASMQNHRLSELMKHDLDQAGVKNPTQQQQREWLTKNLTPYDPRVLTHNLTNMTKIKGDGEGGEGGGTPEDRFKNIESVVNGFRPDVLASTYTDPFSTHKVEYVTDSNVPVVRSEVAKNGAEIFYDEKGNRVEKPSKIRLSFAKNVNSAQEMARFMEASDIKHNKDLTEAQREEKLKDLEKEYGKRDEITVNLKTEQGRRQFHQMMSRILDEPMQPKARFGESYIKTVNDNYDKRTKTGGVY